MPVRYYKSAGFAVDVEALLASSFKRWVAKMDVREVAKNHLVGSHSDVTGEVVLIGGLGVVDGFDAIKRRKSGAIAVTIFELRNAERFIFHRMGPKEKDEMGRFNPNTIVWHMRNTADLEGWKR